MRRARSPTIAALALWLGGCATGSDFGSGTGHAHTAAAGGDGAGANGATGGSTTAATSSASSSGGSTGTTGGCPPLGTNDCPPGLDEVSMSLFDACTMQPITSTIAVYDLGDTGVQANSLQCGDFYFCVDGGTQLTLEVEQPSYANTILETIDVQTSRAYTLLPLICSSLYDELSVGSEGSVIIAQVFSAGGKAACADVSGWSFSLATLDGGPVDAGVVYLNEGNIAPGATVTQSAGIGILYRVDPALGTVALVGTSATSPCKASNFEEEWSNQIQLQSGFAALAPFVIDTDGG